MRRMGPSGTAMHTLALGELAEILSRHSVASDQLQPTALPRFTIFRADGPTARSPGIYRPLICLVIAGEKEVFLGGKITRFRSGDCFLITVDLPVIGTVLKATPQSPYLAFCLDLHLPTLAAIEMKHSEFSNKPLSPLSSGLESGVATAEVLDSALRLVRLLDNQDDIAQLAALYEQELIFRLYSGRWGSSLRAASHGNSQLSRVSRAIAWLHERYAVEFSADQLAQYSGMGVSTLNRHFREVTSMSPLEYQKRIRLQEARRLLKSGLVDASRAAFAVGYSSASQFSREYKRLFGCTPAGDTVQPPKSPKRADGTETSAAG